MSLSDLSEASFQSSTSYKRDEMLTGSEGLSETSSSHCGSSEFDVKSDMYNNEQDKDESIHSDESVTIPPAMEGT